MEYSAGCWGGGGGSLRDFCVFCVLFYFFNLVRIIGKGFEESNFLLCYCHECFSGG